MPKQDRPKGNRTRRVNGLSSIATPRGAGNADNKSFRMRRNRSASSRRGMNSDTFDLRLTLGNKHEHLGGTLPSRV